MFLHFDDLERIMENSRVIVPASSSLWVHMCIRFQKKALERMMHLASAFKYEDPQIRTPADNSFRMTALLTAIKPASLKVLAVSLGYHTFYIIIRLVAREDRPLAINAYYGIDTSNSPFYEIINLSQFLMTTVCFPLFFGSTSLYVYVVTIACSQLEKLKAAILNINQKRDMDANFYQEKEERQIQVPQEMFRHTQEHLNDCIRHHQQILELMNALEESASTILVCHFLLILGGTCFAAFSFVMSFGNPLNMAQSMLVYGSFMLQLYAYCWFGSELTRLAESVRDAAWSCDWVGLPLFIQRPLVFIIAVANKEFTLTAGKFVPVSRTTMLNVINQTVSYVMFLMQVRNREETV
ncbi:odorant receptor 2a-like [Zootermopsis nevadensis]|nr:odorant receptor 2a-like [Zootermopsis nevadensis]